MNAAPVKDDAYNEGVTNTEIDQAPLEFHRFSESPIWQHQRKFFENEAIEGWKRNLVSSGAPNNPLMAHTYVEMILAFWQDSLDMGLIDPEQPLYILELGAGSGELAHGVVQQLFERLEDSHLKLLKPVYIVSDLIQANLDFASNHPKLIPFVTKGQMDFALLDAEDVNQISLYKSGVTLTRNSLHNPLVVIANNVLGCLKQDLIAIHYGKFFDGYIAAESSENRELDLTQYLQYDWRELHDTHHYDSTLLDHYLRYLNSNPILVPSGAINCLDSLSQLTQLPSLILSADRGISTLQQLRQQAAPEFANDVSLSLPVNYNALGLLTEARGGIAMNCQRQLNSIAISALILNLKSSTKTDSFIQNINSNVPIDFNIDSKNFNRTREAFVLHIEQFNPVDATLITRGFQQESHEFTPETILNYLRLSRWDYQIINTFFDNLLQQVAHLQPDERNQWKAALYFTWKNYYPLGNSTEVSARLGILATELGLWGLGETCFQALFNSKKYIEAFVVDTFACYFNLAICCFNLEKREEAKNFVNRALMCTQENSCDVEQCEYLLQKIYHSKKLPEWYDAKLFSQGDLSLQPLRQIHAQDMLCQTRDPNICVMAMLPIFNTPEAVEKWIYDSEIASSSKGSSNSIKKVSMAITHKIFGFVGSIALHILGKKAFFIFGLAPIIKVTDLGRLPQKY